MLLSGTKAIKEVLKDKAFSASLTQGSHVHLRNFNSTALVQAQVKLKDKKNHKC